MPDVRPGPHVDDRAAQRHRGERLVDGAPGRADRTRIGVRAPRSVDVVARAGRLGHAARKRRAEVPGGRRCGLDDDGLRRPGDGGADAVGGGDGMPESRADIGCDERVRRSRRARDRRAGARCRAALPCPHVRDRSGARPGAGRGRQCLPDRRRPADGRKCGVHQRALHGRRLWRARYGRADGVRRRHHMAHGGPGVGCDERVRRQPTRRRSASRHRTSSAPTPARTPSGWSPPTSRALRRASVRPWRSH